MTDYTTLDLLIVDKIRNGAKTFSAIDGGDVYAEAKEIQSLTGRPAFRIIDGRLQALRKKNTITFNYRREWEVI